MLNIQHAAFVRIRRISAKSSSKGSSIAWPRTSGMINSVSRIVQGLSVPSARASEACRIKQVVGMLVLCDAVLVEPWRELSTELHSLTQSGMHNPKDPRSLPCAHHPGYRPCHVAGRSSDGVHRSKVV